MEQPESKFRVPPAHGELKITEFNRVLVITRDSKRREIGIWATIDCLKSEYMKRTLKIIPFEEISGLIVENEELTEVVERTVEETIRNEILISDSGFSLDMGRAFLAEFNLPHLYVTDFANFVEACQITLSERKVVDEKLPIFINQIVWVSQNLKIKQLDIGREYMEKYSESEEFGRITDYLLHVDKLSYIDTKYVPGDPKYVDLIRLVILLFNMGYFKYSSIILHKSLNSLDLVPIFHYLDEIYEKLDFSQLEKSEREKLKKERRELEEEVSDKEETKGKRAEDYTRWNQETRNIDVDIAILTELEKWERTDLQNKTISWASPGLIWGNEIQRLTSILSKFPDGFIKKDYLEAADYFSGGILPRLDLSESYVTGFIIPAMVRTHNSGKFEEYIKLVFPFEYTVPEDPAKFIELLKLPYDVIIDKDQITVKGMTQKFKQVSSNLHLKIIVNPEGNPERRMENYKKIAEGHFSQIQEVHPGAKLLQAGNKYEIHDIPRIIELELGTLETIASNPSCLHRGLITSNGDERTVYFFSSCIRGLMNRSDTRLYPTEDPKELIPVFEKDSQIGYLPSFLLEDVPYLGLPRDVHQFFSTVIPLWAILGLGSFDIHNLEMSRSLFRYLGLASSGKNPTLMKRDKENIAKLELQESSLVFNFSSGTLPKGVRDYLTKEYHIYEHRKYIPMRTQINLKERAHGLLERSKKPKKSVYSEIDRGKVRVGKKPGVYTIDELSDIASRIQEETGRKPKNDTREELVKYIDRYLNQTGRDRKVLKLFDIYKLNSYSDDKLEKIVGKIQDIDDDGDEIEEDDRLKYIKDRLRKALGGKKYVLLTASPIEKEQDKRRKLVKDLINGDIDDLVRGQATDFEELQALIFSIEDKTGLKFQDLDDEEKLLAQLAYYLGYNEDEEGKNDLINPSEEQIIERRRKYKMLKARLGNMSYYGSELQELLHKIEKDEGRSFELPQYKMSEIYMEEDLRRVLNAYFGYGKDDDELFRKRRERYNIANVRNLVERKRMSLEELQELASDIYENDRIEFEDLDDEDSLRKELGRFFGYRRDSIRNPSKEKIAERRRKYKMTEERLMTMTYKKGEVPKFELQGLLKKIENDEDQSFGLSTIKNLEMYRKDNLYRVLRAYFGYEKKPKEPASDDEDTGRESNSDEESSEESEEEGSEKEDDKEGSEEGSEEESPTTRYQKYDVEPNKLKGPHPPGYSLAELKKIYGRIQKDNFELELSENPRREDYLEALREFFSLSAPKEKKPVNKSNQYEEATEVRG